MMKFKWNERFIKKYVSEVNITFFIKEIVLNLIECPSCGYVFENAYHKKSNDHVVFTHSFARSKTPCVAKLEELRTTYHITRAAKIASGEIK